MNLRTVKIEITNFDPRRKKRRFFGNGEWYCAACGVIYTSLEVRSLGIHTECGCPNCGGLFSYEEV